MDEKLKGQGTSNTFILLILEVDTRVSSIKPVIFITILSDEKIKWHLIKTNVKFFTGTRKEIGWGILGLVTICAKMICNWSQATNESTVCSVLAP